MLENLEELLKSMRKRKSETLLGVKLEEGVLGHVLSSKPLTGYRIGTRTSFPGSLPSLKVLGDLLWPELGVFLSASIHSVTLLGSDLHLYSQHVHRLARYSVPPELGGCVPVFHPCGQRTGEETTA